MLIFFHSILCFAEILFLIWFAGHILVSLLNIERIKLYSSAIIKLITGTIAVIACYSIINTSGRTINIGFILIGFLLLIKDNPKTNRLSLVSFHKNFLNN